MTARALGRLLRGGAATRAAAAALGALYVKLCIRTTRWEIEGEERRDALARSGRPFIIAFWHGRLGLCVRLAPKGRRIVAVISANRDGELYARLLSRFGLEAVRGSTADPRKAKDKRGREAFHGALQALREGAVLGITPDGPRGPRMRAQPGVAAISALAGVPVLPATMSVARARALSSWDRFLAPVPFDRGVGLFGEPIEPPADAEPESVEAHRLAIETALNALTAEADRRVGRAPILPDAP